jgi:phosphatidyl-myo-inositol dimannoside synthase
VSSPRTSPRLLLATPDVPPARGGIQLLMGRLTEHLRRFDVEVVTFRQRGLADRIGGHPVRAAVARPRRGHKLAVVALNAHIVLRALRRRPDVVLCGYVTLAPACRLVARVLRVPLAQYVYAEEFRVRPRSSAAAVRAADLTIAISRHTRDLALAAGADPARVALVLPGVDLPDHWSAERAESPPTLVTVARLGPAHKGHDVVLEALGTITATVPDVRWSVVGAGDPSALRQAAEAAGLADRIDWHVDATDAERDRVLDRANVFVLASRVPPGGGGEGFGIVYLEASAHGLPCVGARRGGPADAIVDGRTGLCVDTEDPGAVADACLTLLRDPARARELGTAGRAWAGENAWPAAIARAEDALLDLRPAVRVRGGR